MLLKMQHVVESLVQFNNIIFITKVKLFYKKKSFSERVMNLLVQVMPSRYHPSKQAVHWVAIVLHVLHPGSQAAT